MVKFTTAQYFSIDDGERIATIIVSQMYTFEDLVDIIRIYTAKEIRCYDFYLEYQQKFLSLQSPTKEFKAIKLNDYLISPKIKLVFENGVIDIGHRSSIKWRKTYPEIRQIKNIVTDGNDYQTKISEYNSLLKRKFSKRYRLSDETEKEDWRKGNKLLRR